MKASEVLKKNIEILSRHTVKEDSFVPGSHAPLPQIEAVKKIVSLCKTVFFTDYFYKRQPEEQIRQYYIGVNVEALYSLLKEQVSRRANSGMTIWKNISAGKVSARFCADM